MPEVQYYRLGGDERQLKTVIDGLVLAVLDYRSGTATPVSSVVPRRIGEVYLETTNDLWYMSTGLTNADWKLITWDYQSGAGTPVSSATPRYIGDEYLDTTGNAWYKAYGLTNTSWQAL